MIIEGATIQGTAVNALAAPPSYGTTVAWTSGTYFDSYTSQTSATTDLAATNCTCYQLYYCWNSVQLVLNSSVGIATTTSGTNTWTLCYAKSNSTGGVLGDFGAASNIGSGSGSYGAGTLNEASKITPSTITIPANVYFILGIYFGPFYRAWRTLGANRTAYVGATPYVTATNTIYYTPAIQNIYAALLPSQLGGALPSTQYNGYVPVLSWKFTVV
jgi:hypothetical protein